MKIISLISIFLGLSQTIVVAQDPSDSVMLPPPIIEFQISEPIAVDAFHPNGCCPGQETQFPGGSAAMQKWINRNVVYPLGAIECGIEGRVYVEFVIERDGSISNVKIAKGVSHSLNQEAKRLIKSMPNWVTGKYACNNARTRARVPILFILA